MPLDEKRYSTNPVCRTQRRICARDAFTLIELLIVIGIMGLLIQLMLPAVQSAREAARKTQCANNLRQIALACLQHEGTSRRLPSSGWHYHWIGEPERGSGVDQPGSWAYGVLAASVQKR